METARFSGNIVDIVNRRIFPGTVVVSNGRITSITTQRDEQYSDFLLPGFIDAHVHIESSMLPPTEFARLAVPHGTVATISDPHEIANVVGIEGIRYMIQSGAKVPFHFFFGASSCVPATCFETAGARIDAESIRELFEKDQLKYLSEMMNYPGVLNKDPEVLAKISIAKSLGKPVDGHAPGLRGDEAKRYIEAGISTDHECYTLDEALDKIRYSMKIIIREGSAAKNYQALHPLIKSHPGQVMFCSDDKHPHELVEGHINNLVKRSIADHGYDAMDVLRSASYNPIKHYGLDVGLLQTGDSADFIIVNNLSDLHVKATYIKGELAAKNGKSLIQSCQNPIINFFDCQIKTPDQFQIKALSEQVQVIEAIDGQLITNKLQCKAKIEKGYVAADCDRDILKIAVINRYHNTSIALGLIRGFGLKKGAIASSVAHDSHNIICVGTTDEEMCQAVNCIIEAKGGISAALDSKTTILPLPIGGIMSPDDGYFVAKKYTEIDALAKSYGSSLSAPFMTLSFMALLVIPSIKLSDKGLFDGTSFQFTDLFV